MAENLCLVMGQINPIVGDIAGNVKKIIAAANTARDDLKADLVVFPELTLTGYPPEDLLLRPGLMTRVNQGLDTLKKQLAGIAILIGHPEGEAQTELYNAATLISDGNCLATYYKHRLPNYSVFDEKRYFVEGDKPCVIEFKGIKFGITICEDIWFTEPAAYAADAGAEVIVNLNASPFKQGKWQSREAEIKQRTLETGLPIVYVNLVGGQDELVFDGSSFALSADGEQVVRAPAFQEGLFPISLTKQASGQVLLNGELAHKENDVVMVYQALVQGLRDYIEKNNFPSVVIGYLVALTRH